MQNDWTKPAAVAIPEGGFFKAKVEQGRYGPIFPKTPACYGFSILAKIKPGTKQNFYDYAKRIEKAVAESDARHELRTTQLLAAASARFDAQRKADIEKVSQNFAILEKYARRDLRAAILWDGSK